MNIIVAYVPVLHKGYLNFFKKFGENNILYIPDEIIMKQIEYLWRDMRALKPEEMVAVVKSLGIFKNVMVASIDMILEIAKVNTIVMPDEDISRYIAEFLPPDTKIIFDQVFLRWDKFNVMNEQPVFWDSEINLHEFINKEVFRLAITESNKSSDWWRQVGAVAFKENKIIAYAHNKHIPTELEPYYNGDPRTIFKAGECIDFSGAIHAEAALVARAAKLGISLENAEMLVTTFPCSPCANLVSESGISKLYVISGYARLDAKNIFSQKDIKIIRIKNEPSSN